VARASRPWITRRMRVPLSSWTLWSLLLAYQVRAAKFRLKN